MWKWVFPQVDQLELGVGAFPGQPVDPLCDLFPLRPGRVLPRMIATLIMRVCLRFPLCRREDGQRNHPDVELPVAALEQSPGIPLKRPIR
jgi:hypothetical protein